MIAKTHPDLNALDLFTILRPGPGRQEFESAVAKKAGAEYGLAFTYAHAGFFALLKALGLSGIEVVLPAYICDIMPQVVVATGNTPVFVDIDLRTYNMDLAALPAVLTPRTRVILATHMFGYPADVEAIRELADDARILIVEDAALTFPGATTGAAGLRGDVGLFSFGPGKPLFTIRGGVVVTRDAERYARIKSFRDQQMDPLPLKQWIKRWGLLAIHYLRSKRTVYSLADRLNLSKETLGGLASRLRPSPRGAAQSPSLSLPGDYATRYADFQARIGLGQLRKADRLLARRRDVAARYDQLLQGVPGLVPAPVLEGACYSLYSARVQGHDTLSFVEAMRARDVEVGRTFNYAAPNLPRYRSFVRGSFPHAERLGQEVVNLPIHPAVTEQQVVYIADAVRQVLTAGP